MRNYFSWNELFITSRVIALLRFNNRNWSNLHTYKHSLIRIPSRQLNWFLVSAILDVNIRKSYLTLIALPRLVILWMILLVLLVVASLWFSAVYFFFSVSHFNFKVIARKASFYDDGVFSSETLCLNCIT